MKTMNLRFFLLTILTAIVLGSCNDYPIDENGLLITDRHSCYMSSFSLLGTDNQSVLREIPTVANGLIDTLECTVTAVAKYGTNIRKVKPYCSVTDDIIVKPGMGKFMDFTEPQRYILISGDRQVKKIYTITVTVEQ